MLLVALITEHAVIVRILEHLGEPTRAPRAAPIRDPPAPARNAFLGRAHARHAEPEAAVDGLFLDSMPDNEDQRQDLSW